MGNEKGPASRIWEPGLASGIGPQLVGVGVIMDINGSGANSSGANSSGANSSGANSSGGMSNGASSTRSSTSSANSTAPNSTRRVRSPCGTADCSRTSSGRTSSGWYAGSSSCGSCGSRLEPARPPRPAWPRLHREENASSEILCRKAALVLGEVFSRPSFGPLNRAALTMNSLPLLR